MVDNGSADGSAEAAARRFPRVEVVALARNAGAAARNAGVRRARTPYVAFSDDDSWWQPGALRRAAAALDAHPRLGLVAARTLVGPGCEPDPVNEAMAASPLREGGGATVLGFLALRLRGQEGGLRRRRRLQRAAVSSSAKNGCWPTTWPRPGAAGATRQAADPRMTVVLITRNRREELARTLDMMTSLPQRPCSAWTGPPGGG
jgi:glycosyltransferase involved in cell wall biosynthesis